MQQNSSLGHLFCDSTYEKKKKKRRERERITYMRKLLKH